MNCPDCGDPLPESIAYHDPCWGREMRIESAAKYIPKSDRGIDFEVRPA